MDVLESILEYERELLLKLALIYKNKPIYQLQQLLFNKLRNLLITSHITP